MPQSSAISLIVIFVRGFLSSRFLSDCYKARFVIWVMVHSPLYASRRFVQPLYDTTDAALMPAEFAVYAHIGAFSFCAGRSRESAGTGAHPLCHLCGIHDASIYKERMKCA